MQALNWLIKLLRILHVEDVIEDVKDAVDDEDVAEDVAEEIIEYYNMILQSHH